MTEEILSRCQAAPEEAARITQKLRAEYQSMKGAWHELARRVQIALDRGVPRALGMDRRQWMVETFDQSAQHLYRQMHNLKELEGVSHEIVAQLSESAAHELTRLNEVDRCKPEILHAAVTERPTEFKARVDQIREKKYGIKPDAWDTLSRRLPTDIMERWEEQERRIANLLNLRQREDMDMRSAWVPVYECLMAHFEQTTNIELKAWLIGIEREEEWRQG